MNNNTKTKYVPPHLRNRTKCSNPGGANVTKHQRVPLERENWRKYCPPHQRFAQPAEEKKDENIIPHKWDHEAIADGKDRNFCNEADREIHEFLMENSEGYFAWREAKKMFGSNPLNDSYFKGKFQKRQNKNHSNRWGRKKDHMLKYKRVMVKMQKEYGIVEHDLERFADICCAPGGFAAGVLDVAPNCTGQGLTIDPSRDLGDTEKAGHIMELEDSDRWMCFYRDVTVRPEELIFFGAKHRCQLMIVDGNFLLYRGKESASEFNKRLCLVNNFLMSRLLVGFLNIQDGGNMIIQNATKPSCSNFWLWKSLLGLFENIVIVKAELGCHRLNNSGYILCYGFNYRKFLEVDFLGEIRRLMKMLAEGKHNWFELEYPDLGGFLDTYGDKIIELLEPVWSRQAMHLRTANKTEHFASLDASPVLRPKEKLKWSGKI